MREALIILPKNDNAGHPVRHAHNTLTNALVATFGGATKRDATGYWQGQYGLKAEPVIEYTVACEDNADARGKLRCIALQAGHDAKQIAVYVRHANGEVVFYEVEPVAEAA